MPLAQSKRGDREWDPLLICPNRKLATELDDLLSSELHLTQLKDWKTYPAEQALAELMTASAPIPCFVDICSDHEQAFRVLSQLVDFPSPIPVVALFSENDPALILRCLRRGAAGFLLRPFSAEQLQQVLNKIVDLCPNSRSSPENSGKVYCVVAAKGSCGATTIATNLAYQAKQQGSDKVLLADMDPLTSTIPFLLKLESQYSFVDAILHANHLDADLWKALVSSYRGVDVLPSPENPVDAATIEGHDPTEILDYARRTYRLVVLHSGGPYGPWNLRLMNLSDELLLVLTNELSAIYGAQRVLAYLDRSGISRSKIRLLVNRYHKNVGLDRAEIETALRMEVFHLLPNDREAVDNALMEGRPVPANARFGKSLVQLAALLIGQSPLPKKHPSPGVLLSFFSRVSK
jgi:pilus assembly protein CpaE